MTEKLRLALVGCGAIARYHLDGINESAPRIQVTAVIDPDLARADEYAQETGATAYASLSEALQDDTFDAVDIMVPHHLHEELTLMAFNAGKHVLLEKPMAPTLDACQRILDAAKAAREQHPHLVFMVAENAQYWPEIVRAQELIEEGTIGDIITAHAAFVMEIDPYFFSDPKAWRYDLAKSGGGIVIDGGSHWIRPLRMWMGEIDSVVSVLGHPLTQMEGESLSQAIIRFQSGKTATFDTMMVESTLAPHPWWRITGTKGEIIIEDGFEGRLMLFNAENCEGLAVGRQAGYAKSFGPELKDFSDVVLDRIPPAAGPEHSLGELRTALAIYRSAESGQWEPVWT
ncbi:MAG: Gfo/Idh/MocA family oxidoreductase [Chloroflexota bacterium]